MATKVAAAAGASGTGNHTVMLRVNGAAMMARGANMVPMEVLEGRYAPGQHRNIVASAAAANFNTLRVCTWTFDTRSAPPVCHVTASPD